MESRIRGLTSFMVLVVLAVSPAACTDTEGPAHGEPAPVAVTAAATLEASPSCAPILIALLRDRTRSAVVTATPAVTVENVEALLSLVQTCGGEIGYGEIVARGQSFKPLTRIRVEQPPTPPVRRTDDDAFEQQRLNTLYRRQFAAFRHQRERFETRTARDIGTFRSLMTGQLALPPTAGSSDVLGAVERALLFLQEPQVGWDAPPRGVMVLVSDAQHNTGPWTLEMPQGIDVLLVNGIGSMGTFDGSDARLFESVDSALRWLGRDASDPRSAKK